MYSLVNHIRVSLIIVLLGASLMITHPFFDGLDKIQVFGLGFFTLIFGLFVGVIGSFGFKQLRLKYHTNDD